ncbi:MAG: hypothetical protein C0490_20720 [Marivirga sp.]|nr:hypothetical protein [Marivirga sp.]
MRTQNDVRNRLQFLQHSRMEVFGKISILLFFVIFIISCDDDDSGPKGKYEDGALVINEGGFGAANGTITYYNVVSGEVEQNIFRNATGDFAGDVVQSITFKDEKGYVVINGDNKIEIINGNTFESLGTIENEAIDKPRYIEVINNRAYVSVWGPYEDGGYSLIDSYVLVIDLSNNTVIKKIQTDEGTDNLIQAGNYLFASNNNFGASNSLAVIDPTNNTLVDQITLASGPAGLATDVNGKLWVICGGDYGSSNGQLFRINTSTLVVEETIDLNVSPDGDLAVTPDKRNLIYSSGKNVYRIAITSTDAPTEPLFEADEVVTNYALAVDPDNGDIWLGDALNYTSAGKVYIYNASGDFKSSFDAGISPTQFVFK